MKPRNMPARRLLRQLHAGVHRGVIEDAGGMQAMLDAARARRSKIKRTHKRGSAS